MRALAAPLAGLLLTMPAGADSGTDEPDADTGLLPDAAVSAVLSISTDPDYGEYLAGECVTCHQDKSGDGGVPRIHGLPMSYLVLALLEYRDGTRPNDVMRLMSAHLGDGEIAALALHFATRESE